MNITPYVQELLLQHKLCSICLWIWISLLNYLHQQPCFSCFILFHPNTHSSLQQTVLSIFGNQLSMNFCPFFFQDTKKHPNACCLSFVQTSSAAASFTHSTNWLQLNHTQSMSPSDLELQHDQASTCWQPQNKIFSCPYILNFLHTCLNVQACHTLSSHIVFRKLTLLLSVATEYNLACCQHNTGPYHSHHQSASPNTIQSCEKLAPSQHHTARIQMQTQHLYGTTVKT
jgi:hypothetical protein